MKGNNIKTPSKKTGNQKEKKRIEKLAAKKHKGEKMKKILASLATMEKANLNVNAEMNEKRKKDLRSSKHMRREKKESRKRKDRPKPEKGDESDVSMSSESEDDNYNPYAACNQGAQDVEEGVQDVNER